MVSERVEICRSRSRLIRYNLISIGGVILSLGMAFGCLAFAFYEFQKAGSPTFDVIVSSLGVIAFLWLMLWTGPRKRAYDRPFRRGPECLFVLTREGLACSFLGSNALVPWADVRKVQWQQHGIELGLRVDPARHPNRPPDYYRSKISRCLDDGTRLEKWVIPDILDVKMDELAELLKDWQLQYTAALPEAA